MLFSSKLFGRRVDWVIAAVVATVLVLVGVAFANRPRKFDEAEWKRGALMLSADNPRWAMRGDVVRQLRPGMPQNEVRAKFGTPMRRKTPSWPVGMPPPPASTPSWQDPSWIYILGKARERDPHVMCIYIRFDAVDKIETVHVMSQDPHEIQIQAP